MPQLTRDPVAAPVFETRELAIIQRPGRDGILSVVPIGGRQTIVPIVPDDFPRSDKSDLIGG